MKAKELIKLIQKNGWFFERQSGSHKIFKHPTNKGIVVIPDHGNDDIIPSLFIKKSEGQ